MKGRLRRYTIVLLLILTLGLAGASVYIGYELSTQEQAPEESEAAGGQCTYCEDDGSINACCDPDGPTCTTTQEWFDGWNQCNGEDDDPTTDCRAEIAADMRSITLKGGCSNIPLKRYWKDYFGDERLGYPHCITNDSNGTGEGIVYVGDGTYSPDAAPGTCAQIDTDNPDASACECVPEGGEGGDGGLGCNTACEEGDECGLNLLGDELECIDGICQNPDCEEQNEYCVCTGGTCGERCGPSANNTLCSGTDAFGTTLGCYLFEDPTAQSCIFECMPHLDDVEAVGAGVCGNLVGTTDYYKAPIENHTVLMEEYCEPSVSEECGDGVCNTGEYCENPGATGGIECPSGDALSIECRSDCTYCGDGVVNGTEECDHGGTPTAACDVNCELVETQDTLMCVVLERASSNPVGPNEIEIFSVEVNTTGDTMPYDLADVKLRVSLTTDDVAVGEDFYVSGQAIATARYAAQVSETNWEYHFAWQASSLANGNYEVEVSFDGGSTWDDTAACILDFTYDSGEEVDPAFLIVKTGTAVCSTAGGATLTYTLTVTNLGPGSGVITNVTDEVDSSIQDSWVTNITSSTGVAGTISNGVITWTGTEEQRTFAENESQTYSYTINVPNSSLSVVNDGVENVATVTYGDDQVRYNYYLDNPCGATGDLPATGFTDQTPWILGIAAMLIGMIALRLGGGEEYIYPAIRKVRFAVFTHLGLKSLEAKVSKKELEDRYR